MENPFENLQKLLNILVNDGDQRSREYNKLSNQLALIKEHLENKDRFNLNNSGAQSEILTFKPACKYIGLKKAMLEDFAVKREFRFTSL